jgi:hypothetical protein
MYAPAKRRYGSNASSGQCEKSRAWQRGDFEQVLALTGSDGQMARCFALLALGRQPEAIEAWESVAKTFSPLTASVREWIESVREFLTLSEVSRAAVFKNLDGAFDPEEIFFVGTQAARLGMPEALTMLAQAVDAGYAAADTLARHPWIAPIRGEAGFADLLRRAEQARERALVAFREAGGPTLLGLETDLRPTSR